MALGLGCVGLAVIEVGRSVRTNREVAERARIGYAQFALWSYREHLAEVLRGTAREVLGAVNHGDAMHVSPNIPAAADLGHYLPYAAHCGCHLPRFGPMPLAFYGFTIGADTVGVGPNFSPSPNAGWLADPAEGAPLPSPSVFRLPGPEGRWLSGLLAREARAGFSPWGYRYTMAEWQGESRFFVATLMPTTWGDTLVYAAEYSHEAIDSLLGAVLDDPALLPVGADRGPPPPGYNRRVLSLEVSGPGGPPLLSWAVPDEWPTPPTRLPESYAGLAIQAAIVPTMLDQLVIGGLPADRTPMLLGLLALAAGLTVVAAIQLRRELRFARARSDFVANVSHELRTPLTQIRLMLDTMQMPSRGDRASRPDDLGMIDREVLRLQHLVDRVLRFRQGEAAEPLAVRTPLSLAAEVATVVAEFRPLALARGVTIEERLLVDATVAMESGTLRQVLLNLLDNAVKYGPRDAMVRVTLEGEGATVRLLVDDAGPGVPDAERQRIFAPYERGAVARDQAVGGSGIGLTVVRDLVSRHGGSVSAAGAPGGGARFVVTLPRVP